MRSGQGALVQLQPAAWRDRILDGHSRQLVAELQPFRPGLQHSRRHALVDQLQCAAGHLSQQPGLHRRRHHGCGFEYQPGGRGELGRSGQDRISHGRRNVLASSREHLGHEEGIPGGRSEQAVRIDPAVADDARHGVPRQRPQLEPAHGSHVAQQHRLRRHRAGLSFPLPLRR
jgi:hypothetical protein